MKLSARNQFAGKITKVAEGAVNGIVTLDVNGTSVSATISMASIQELGLKEGVEAVAIVKATEVMVATSDLKISARNQFAGKVTAINEGAVNAIVTIDAAGMVVTSTISLASVKELGLAVGSEATAVIKATSVMIGVN